MNSVSSIPNPALKSLYIERFPLSTSLLVTSVHLLSNSGIPGLCVGGKSTMSSVAVLTQESFAEHRSGLAQQQVKGKMALGDSLETFAYPVPPQTIACID